MSVNLVNPVQASYFLELRHCHSQLRQLVARDTFESIQMHNSQVRAPDSQGRGKILNVDEKFFQVWTRANQPLQCPIIEVHVEESESRKFVEDVFAVHIFKILWVNVGTISCIRTSDREFQGSETARAWKWRNGNQALRPSIRTPRADNR